jgi:hypothetical protein
MLSRVYQSHVIAAYGEPAFVLLRRKEEAEYLLVDYSLVIKLINQQLGLCLLRRGSQSKYPICLEPIKVCRFDHRKMLEV